jgi:hypothetical protein
MGLIQSIFRETPSLPVSLAWLAAICLMFLSLAAAVVSRREYVLEQ